MNRSFYILLVLLSVCFSSTFAESILITETLGTIAFEPDIPKHIEEIEKDLRAAHKKRYGRKSRHSFEFDPFLVPDSEVLLSHEIDDAFNDFLKEFPSGVSHKEFLISFVFSKILFNQMRGYYKYKSLRRERMTFAMAQLYQRMGSKGSFGLARDFEEVKDYFTEKSSAVVDFSAPYEEFDYLGDLARKLEGNWPPLRISWSRKNPPKSDAEFRDIVYYKLNRHYLQQAFVKVLRTYGHNKVPEYKLNLRRAKPAPLYASRTYQQRTDGKSPGQKYQKEVELTLAAVSVPYKKELSEREALSAFNKAKHLTLLKMEGDFSDLLEEHNRETGSYEGAEEKLSALRLEAFQNLISNLETSMQGKAIVTKQYRQKVELNKLYALKASTRKIVTPLIRDYQIAGRILFPVYILEHVKNKEAEGGVIKLIVITNYIVLSHVPMSDVYHNIERSFYVNNIKNAEADLLKHVFAESYMPTGGQTIWGFEKKDKKALVDLIGTHNAEKLISIAAIIESQKQLREATQ